MVFRGYQSRISCDNKMENVFDDYIEVLKLKRSIIT